MSIFDPSLAHMAWSHPVATVIIDATDQQRFGLAALEPVRGALLVELGLPCVKEITIDDGGLFARKNFALERELADIELIAKMGERTSREGDRADRSSGLEPSHLWDDPARAQVGPQPVE